VSLYIVPHLLSIHQAVHNSTWYQRTRLGLGFHPITTHPYSLQPATQVQPSPREAHPSLAGRLPSQPPATPLPWPSPPPLRSTRLSRASTRARAAATPGAPPRGGALPPQLRRGHGSGKGARLWPGAHPARARHGRALLGAGALPRPWRDSPSQTGATPPPRPQPPLRLPRTGPLAQLSRLPPPLQR
jgi:hypothetical protein